MAFPIPGIHSCHGLPYSWNPQLSWLSLFLEFTSVTPSHLPETHSSHAPPHIPGIYSCHGLPYFWNPHLSRPHIIVDSAVVTSPLTVLTGAVFVNVTLEWAACDQWQMGPLERGPSQPSPAESSSARFSCQHRPSKLPMPLPVTALPPY